jgi:hypothetical protein
MGSSERVADRAIPPAVKNACPAAEMTQMRALRLAREVLNLNGAPRQHRPTDHFQRAAARVGSCLHGVACGVFILKLAGRL